MEFLSIIELLETGTSHGSIASAIEQKCKFYGWDRFGRYREFVDGDPSSTEVCKDVLNALAADYAWFSDPMPEEEKRPRWVVFGEFPLLGAYGWTDSKKIDFSEYDKTDESSPPRPKINSKAEDNNIRIIGALKACLVGEDREAFIKACPKLNDTNLINFLGDHYRSFGGLTKRNLEEKFAKGKRLLSE